MKAETLEVAGFEPAIKGMRNPMNSWRKDDSTLDPVYDVDSRNIIGYNFSFGEDNLRLAQQLIKAGTEHCKFLRFITVWMDITMPRYWWSEFDTYKFVEKNSCSTMHKLFQKDKDITLDDFYIEDYFLDGSYVDIKDTLKDVTHDINMAKQEYFENNKDAKYLRAAKQLLPESFLQTRTIVTNYQELRNIYHQRKNHRLDKEWGVLLDEIRALPYANELIVGN
ncbi:hypothetical protein [Peptostreptococcus faecalis]|uniref:hypothetical protein n=1 Tax=Peptostreptococcus faecalis TaxID=2045015 RepID=UPI000C7999D1|nr:hypothetical protein [Peptostreptococcus faecalis]